MVRPRSPVTSLAASAGRTDDGSDRHFLFHQLAALGDDHGDIVPALKVHPEFGPGAEVPAQAQGCLRRDGTVTAQDCGNPVCGHADGDGQLVGTHTSCLQFLSEHRFFSVLSNMVEKKRRVMLRYFQEACPAELPHNLHIHADLLRRRTGETVDSLNKILGGLESIGFFCYVSYRLLDRGTKEIHNFLLDWVALTSGGEESPVPDLVVVRAMTDAISMLYCDEHSTDTLDRLDLPWKVLDRLAT